MRWSLRRRPQRVPVTAVARLCAEIDHLTTVAQGHRADYLHAIGERDQARAELAPVQQRVVDQADTIRGLETDLAKALAVYGGELPAPTGPVHVMCADAAGRICAHCAPHLFPLGDPR
jgi:hypothetical protein